MTKQLLTSLSLTILASAFFVLNAEGQLVRTSLIEDIERKEVFDKKTEPHFKIAATAYTDTLRLPFFEDFTDVVVPLDSIVIDNTTDSIVRVYGNVLNSFPDSSYICVGFTNPKSNTTTNTVAKTAWYIHKTGPNEFILDSTKNGSSQVMKIDVDTVLRNGFWRLINRNYSTQLDSLKWISGGNTYVNNRYPSEPVSYNVATFDGLKSDGIPYNTVAILAKGFSDNLTSLPINLKPYLPSDSIYFSCFWQHSGIGDTPESDDYLQLEFKDSTGVWNTVKTISGNQAYTNAFKIELIPVINPIYFSKHFQFRIRSWGRLSGPFDIWNVDYIYLDKNRTKYDTIFDDKTVGNVPATFLTRYTAMPYNQFFANKTAESGDINFTDNNLGRGIPSQEFFYAIADFNVFPGNTILSKDTSAKHFPDASNSAAHNQRTFFDVCTPDVSTFNNQNQPIYLEQGFRIPASDTANILFANNNKFSTKTILWDYYAYDDGTPEWGIGGNQIGVKIANKFNVTLSDTLTDIDIYFTRSKGPNMEGRTILLSVWNNSKTLVSQQAVQVGYGGFKRYKLTTPFIVGAGEDCYVGYQQNFVDLLSVGYDKNYDRSDKIYFNLTGSDWNSYDQQPGYSQGSMMIRAVFNKNETLVTPVKKETETDLGEVILYPVPTNDLLHIQGKISSITLYDFTGRKVAFQRFDPFQEAKEISTLHLPDGIYIAELTGHGTTKIRKILVQHEF